MTVEINTKTYDVPECGMDHECEIDHTAQLQELQQDIFRISSTHLLTQMAKSEKFDKFGALDAYRGDHGRMDAIGCLIADSVYATYGTEFEGLGVHHPTVLMALTDSGWPVHHTQTQLLLETLQDIHDSYDPDEWKGQLANLARDFKLVFNP